MLSEKGSIETASISVERPLVLYRKNLKLISLILLIVGAAGTVAYIVLGTVWETLYETSPWWIKALLVFAVPFALGLIGYITVVRLHKRELAEARKSECEFFADCFFCKTESPSETQKFVYSDAILKKENEEYGYIYIFKRAILVPFSKENLSVSELNAVRKNFRKEIPDSEEIANLQPFKED